MLDFVKAHAGANYILKLRHSQAVITTNPDAKKPNPDGEYNFDKVHFRYPLRRNIPVLSGLDLKVRNITSQIPSLMAKFCRNRSSLVRPSPS